MRLIDEDALIHRICEERDCVKLEHASDIGYRNGLNMAVSMILNAPTIEARPVVRGEWECEHKTWGKLQCSVCKKQALLEKAHGDFGEILLYVTSNFCPNCGAEMWTKEEE